MLDAQNTTKFNWVCHSLTDVVFLCIYDLHLTQGIVDEDIWKAHKESVITIEGVFLLTANDNCLALQVFPQHDLQVSTIVEFVLSFQVVLEHFKMYIMITDIVREKRIDLAYLMQGKEVAIISMFSDNVQYQIK